MKVINKVFKCIDEDGKPQVIDEKTIKEISFGKFSAKSIKGLRVIFKGYNADENLKEYIKDNINKVEKPKELK